MDEVDSGDGGTPQEAEVISDRLPYRQNVYKLIWNSTIRHGEITFLYYEETGLLICIYFSNRFFSCFSSAVSPCMPRWDRYLRIS
jgi:hypothetical protein